MHHSEEVPLAGIIVAGVFIIVIIIVFIMHEMHKDAQLKEARKHCTAEKLLALWRTKFIQFGFHRNGTFVMDQTLLKLEVLLTHPLSESSDRKKDSVLKLPKDIYRSKEYNPSMTFTLQLMIKNRSDERVVHVEFYKFYWLSSTKPERSIQAFADEWVAFFNDHRYQNDGEKQYFQIIQEGKPYINETAIHVQKGTTVFDATQVPSKVTISGNGKMIIHGDVTF